MLVLAKEPDWPRLEREKSVNPPRARSHSRRRPTRRCCKETAGSGNLRGIVLTKVGAYLSKPSVSIHPIIALRKDDVRDTA